MCSYVRRPLVKRDRTSKSLSRTRLEPAHSLCLRLRLRHGRGRPAVERCALSARTKRSPHNGWTAFRMSLQVAFGHPPGPYAFRGLLASALRAFPSSQRPFRFMIRLA